jgi:hypothetical protein
MGSRSDEYRQKADECERLARAVRHADVKAALMLAAQQWRDRAKATERRAADD